MIEVAQTGNTSLILGSVYNRLSNLHYKNNGDLKKQWRSICANKQRLRYRNNHQLIVLCLQNENEFNLQTKQLVINIDKILDNIDKIYEERQDKINYFLQQKETVFDISNLEQNDVEHACQLITVYDDPLRGDDQGVFELEDELELAFQDPPPKQELEVELPSHKYNLRKQARKNYKE